MVWLVVHRVDGGAGQGEEVGGGDPRLLLRPSANRRKIREIAVEAQTKSQLIQLFLIVMV